MMLALVTALAFLVGPATASRFSEACSKGDPTFCPKLSCNAEVELTCPAMCGKCNGQVARRSVSPEAAITTTGGMLTFKAANQPGASVHAVSHDGRVKVDLLEAVEKAVLAAELSSLTKDIRASVTEEIESKVGQSHDDLKGQLDASQETLSEEISAVSLSIRQSINPELEALGSTIETFKKTVETDLSLISDGNYACVAGYGGELCQDDVLAPLYSDHEGFPDRQDFKVATKKITTDILPRPTIKDTGPGEPKKVNVKISAVSPSLDETLLAEWESATSGKEVFDWGKAKLLKKNGYTAKTGRTLIKYKVTDDAGNSGVWSYAINVGTSLTDTCGVNSCKCLEHSDTTGCQCSPGYMGKKFGGGYACEKLPCIESGQTCANLPSGVPSGEYASCSDPNLKYECEMDLEGGGWTFVANVNPADGNSVGYKTKYWNGDSMAEYGNFDARFETDYRSPAASTVTGDKLMYQARKPKSGDLLGYRLWKMDKNNGNSKRTWNSLFGKFVGDCHNCGVHRYKPCTTGNSYKVVRGSQTSWDDILHQGNCIYTDVNPSNSGWGDTIRFTTTDHRAHDNKMSGFASCIDCGHPWQGGSDSYMGMDRAPCNKGECHYHEVRKVQDFDCRGRYCGGTYAHAHGSPIESWNSRFYVK